jgi:hypothetical protein
VPPPPVCGAAVVVAGALVAGAADRVAWLDADALALGLVVEWPEAVPPDEVFDVGAEWVAPGEDEVEDEDGEHPATATTRMARTPKPLMARFALSTMPAMVPRTVM